MTFVEFLDFVKGFGYETIEISAHKDSHHLDIIEIISGGAKKINKEVSARSLSISALSNHFEGMLVMGPLDESTDAWSLLPDAESKIKFGTERMIKTAQAA